MRKIVEAKAEDKDEILNLYKIQLGREFCPWDGYYPEAKEIDFDLSRYALFVSGKSSCILWHCSLLYQEVLRNLPGVVL